MLIVFIIIQLTYEVLWLRSYSIELMTGNKKTRFLRLRIAITINSHILLGGRPPRPPSWLRPCLDLTRHQGCVVLNFRRFRRFKRFKRLKLCFKRIIAIYNFLK